MRRRDKITARRRQAQLGSGGKQRMGLTKRPYTGSCELCGAKQCNLTSGLKKLHYHHWDDNTPSIGLWLCGDCHRGAEGMDIAIDNPEQLQQYANLKATAIRIYHESRLI